MSDLAQRRRVLIMGAAGRDFHNFLCCYRDDPHTEVVAFTAAQIPSIAERRYPASLAGPSYPDGIPMYPETDLERLITTLHVDEVVFAYSDVANQTVMLLAQVVLAAEASYTLLGPRATMLSSVSRFLNSITWADASSFSTDAQSWAARRPHSNAALLLSTATPLSSMARIRDSRPSGIQPFCQA